MRGTLHSQDEFKDLEFEWRKKEGTPITVRCSGRRVREENGHSAFHEVFAEDVTDNVFSKPNCGWQEKWKLSDGCREESRMTSTIFWAS